jgi:signal transduction histidine kinase
VTDLTAVGRPAEFYRFLHTLSSQLRDTLDADKVLRQALRAAAASLEADDGCVAALEPGEEATRVVASHPADAAWDDTFFTALVRRRHPEFPRGLIAAQIERRSRPWGVIALRRASGRFERWQERSLAPVAQEIERHLARLDRDRLLDVRARIDRKIIRELPPKDLYYQILDGLHQLTRYDHSSALYIADPESGVLRLVAEQIAWRKQRSQRIGREIAIREPLAALLGGSFVYGFDRVDGGWREWTELGAGRLAESLEPSAGDAAPDTLAADAGAAPHVRSMVCAPLAGPGGTVGLLCLAGQRIGRFGPYERDLLDRFTPLVSLVLQRSRRVESLHEKLVDIERRNTMATLARGVAHDINNAMGSVVPLVQQMREELDQGRLDPALLREDLARIESALDTCRRIFAGMLRFARGASRHDGVADLRRAVDATRAVLEQSMERSGIRTRAALPETLPSLRGGQEDLERLVLNLATNARDAMPGGGTLHIGASVEGDAVTIEIRDNGVGIPPELLRQVERPFFTTKADGWGLGLPTCRSIVSEMGGEMRIESEVGRGTRVTVRLQAASGSAG